MRITDTPAYREWLRIHDALLVAYRTLNIAAIRDLGWQARAVMSEEEFLKIVDTVEEILGDSIGLQSPVDEDTMRDQTMPFGWDVIDTSIPEDEQPW